MVTGTFTAQMEAAGTALIAALDKAGMEISAALWLFITEQNGWMFVLATPEVASSGPKRVYQRIQSVIAHWDQQLPSIGLADVSVVQPDHPIISLLAKAVKTSSGISGIRFSRNTINGHFIEDAYIYRIR